MEKINTQDTEDRTNSNVDESSADLCFLQSRDYATTRVAPGRQRLYWKDNDCILSPLRLFYIPKVIIY